MCCSIVLCVKEVGSYTILSMPNNFHNSTMTYKDDLWNCSSDQNNGFRVHSPLTTFLPNLAQTTHPTSKNLNNPTSTLTPCTNIPPHLVCVVGAWENIPISQVLWRYQCWEGGIFTVLFAWNGNNLAHLFIHLTPYIMYLFLMTYKCCSLFIL